MQFHFFNFLELLKSVFLILRLKSKMARIYLQKKFPIFGDYVIEKTTRKFSLVTCYLLKFTRCSLLVVEPLVTRCKICSLLVVEVARCIKLLVTCCRNCWFQKHHSLLVAKFARYSLQKLLLAKNHSLLVAKVACYSLQKLLVSKNHPLLVSKVAHYSLQKSLLAEVAHCKNSLVTHCITISDRYLQSRCLHVRSLLTGANFS